MVALSVVAVFVAAGLCLAGGKAGCRRFFRRVAALLYLPVGTLVSLIRKCR